MTTFDNPFDKLASHDSLLVGRYNNAYLTANLGADSLHFATVGRVPLELVPCPMAQNANGGTGSGGKLAKHGMPTTVQSVLQGGSHELCKLANCRNSAI
jgi:hypothetical protein